MGSALRGSINAAAAIAQLRSRAPARIGASLASLLEKSARRTRAGVLFLEGTEAPDVLFVLSGWLSLSKALDDGNTQVIDFALPGDIVLPASGDGITAEFTIEVLEEGFVAVIPSARWEQLMHDDPDILHLSLQDAAAYRSRCAERMLRLGRGNAEMRLAYALLELCIRLSGGQGAPTAAFHVPLCQRQIGNFIGLSSVHISRTARHLARKGMIEMTDHLTFQLKDVDALCEIAGVDMKSLRHEILLPHAMTETGKTRRSPQLFMRRPV